ncbi:hypothetical protein PICSAR10_04136 [Mycobacterium avium subsp. paratuberculosis]|nr:hypothetical protein PICSAR10_04136 [Mycobacterium avium subsp. paratuberculosis]
MAWLGVAFTNGGISRFRPARLVSGLNTTSFQAAAMALASLMTLRPVLSVPAIDGNLESWRVVAPSSSTTSAISSALPDSTSVAGPTARSTSVIAWFLASNRSASAAVSVTAASIWSERALSLVSSELVRLIRSPKARPWSPVALPAPLTMLVKLRTAPPLTSRAAELSTLSTVAAARVAGSPMVSPALSSGALGSAGTGGLIATNTSPSGVAERSSAVLPTGTRTPSMMRSVVTAV